MQNNVVDVSIVIPLYNKEKSIERAILSVLNQTHKNFELIIVNDGSTDNSKKNANNIHDSRFKLIDQKNKGVSAARNRGVLAASTNYICFLDADDEWHPHFLKEILNLIKINPNAGIFCTRYKTIDEKGKDFVGKISLPEGYAGHVNDFFSCFRKSRSLICSSNVCMNKKNLQEVGGFPEGFHVGEDIYVWLRMGIIANVMFSSRISVVVYRNAENRTITRLETQIPYHLEYFLSPSNFGGAKYLLANRSLRKFVVHNTVIFALAAAMAKRRKITRRYAMMILPYSITRAASILLCSFFPASIFELGKKMRNTLTVI